MKEWFEIKYEYGTKHFVMFIQDEHIKASQNTYIDREWTWEGLSEQTVPNMRKLCMKKLQEEKEKLTEPNRLEIKSGGEKVIPWEDIMKGCQALGEIAEMSRDIAGLYEKIKELENGPIWKAFRQIDRLSDRLDDHEDEHKQNSESIIKMINEHIK